jgi:impB/mucB/samB family
MVTEDGSDKAFFWRCAVKQILCVRLTQWSIDRIKRKREARGGKSQGPNPKSQISNLGSPTPVLRYAEEPGRTAKHPAKHPALRRTSEPASVVLVRTVASRQLVVFACENARRSGIDPGMTLAEANALCENLQHQEHQPEKDLQGLYRLARWMVRFSPVVAIEPPDALFLDITGSERLFHGLDQLAKLVHISLTKLRLNFRIAIAETPGAAWAFTLEEKCERRTSNVERRTSK